MELESQRKRFQERGLGLAALSYDSTGILAAFATRRKITYPLLSDPESKVIRQFGLQNEIDYPPGHLAHGVPYPGTFVLDAQGIVRARHFEKGYAERRTAASVLTLAGESLVGGAETRTETATFSLRAWSSNASAAAGQRVTLVLDFAMKPRMHAYAPGVTGYRPLRVRIEPQPLLSVAEAKFPPSTPYRFAPLDETVPVLAGRFRVSQDVTLAGARELAELLKTPDPKLDIVGTLEYQVCSDTLCYPPATLPLRFTLAVEPLDLTRAPDDLRHQPPTKP